MVSARRRKSEVAVTEHQIKQARRKDVPTRTPPLTSGLARQRLQLLAHELIAERLPAKWGKAVAFKAAETGYWAMVRVIQEELGREEG
jgi:hypothetical protein